MTSTQILLIITVAMSATSLAMVCIALLPQLKEGMAIVRDAVLWGALIAIVAVIAAVGWLRLIEQRSPPGSRDADRQAEHAQLPLSR